MTVVAGDEGTATLICDRCGCQDLSADVRRDSEVVWPLVARLGWAGSPFATGSHWCPQCCHAGAPPAAGTVGGDAPPAQGPWFGIEVDDDAGAVVVTPLADLDARLSERLRDDLMRAAAAHAHLLVDLHAVRFIDSAGLSLLVRARQETRRHGGEFSLVAPSRFVQTVLHTMRLDRALRTFPDRRSAVRA
jgi:anti-sigma B factor antagonist